MISLQGVSKRYGFRAPVLDALDLELAGGVTVAVEGANGVGKSTLLRLVAGLSTPSRGRVVRAPGARVGYAPEGFAAVAGLTGRAWLAQLGWVRGRSVGDVGLAAADALGAPLDRPLTALSHGQRQRVALAAALAGLLGAVAARGALVVYADHVGLPGATRRLRVRDGGVEWLAVQAPARRMRIVGAGGQPPDGWPGLVEVGAGADGAWVALVEADASDGLLAAVLAAGASVREVGPA